MNTINIAQEMAFADQSQFEMSLLAHSLLHPKSRGVMALEEFAMGSTSISTEGVWSTIKEKAVSIASKAGELLAKFGTWVWKQKYWIIGGLTVVAAFAGTTFALLRKGQEEAAKAGNAEGAKERAKTMKESLSKLYDNALAKVKNIVKREKKEQGGNSKEADIKEAKARRRKKHAEWQRSLDASKGKAKGILSKIVDAVKKMVGLTKSNGDDLARIASSAEKQPGNEGFIAQAAWFAKNPFKRLGLMWITCGLSEVYHGIIKSVALSKLCVAHVEAHGTKD